MITNLRCHKCNPKVCPNKAVECARHLHEAAIGQDFVLATERPRLIYEELVATTNIFVYQGRER